MSQPISTEGKIAPAAAPSRGRVALFTVAFLAVYVVVVFGGLELARALAFPYVAPSPHVTMPATALGVTLPALWYLGGRERGPAGRRVVIAILATVPSLALCVWGARAVNALADVDAGRWLEYRVSEYHGRGNWGLTLEPVPGLDAPRLEVERALSEAERPTDTPVWVLIRPGLFHAPWVVRHEFAPPTR